MRKLILWHYMSIKRVRPLGKCQGLGFIPREPRRTFVIVVIPFLNILPTWAIGSNGPLWVVIYRGQPRGSNSKHLSRTTAHNDQPDWLKRTLVDYCPWGPTDHYSLMLLPSWGMTWPSFSMSTPRWRPTSMLWKVLEYFLSFASPPLLSEGMLRGSCKGVWSMSFSLLVGWCLYSLVEFFRFEDLKYIMLVTGVLQVNHVSHDKCDTLHNLWLILIIKFSHFILYVEYIIVSLNLWNVN